MEQKVAKIISFWTETICHRVENRWGNMSGIEGIAEIHATLPKIVGSIITSEISAGGDKAWIAEYGSGHLLDESSPYFNDYKKSDRFNPARTADGNEFIGRKAGDIIFAPDGSEYASSGRAEGMRLEHPLGELPPYKAFAPTHVILEEVKKVLPSIAEDISQAVALELLQKIRLNINVYM
jgi:hypothetical protein